MGWTDLFRSKTGRLKPDPRIRWFGKLPTYPDYYSSPADEGWAIEFNDWVLKGIELYQGRLSGTRDTRSRMPLCNCVIRLPKSGMTVLASILDFGGDMRGRPFPICFYAGLPAPEWPGPTSHTLAGAVRALRDLLALRHKVGRFINSPGHFETVFGDREVDLTEIDEESVDDSWAESAKSIEMATWYAGASGVLKAPDRETWLRLAAGWGDAVAKHEGKEFEPTLRFPLATGVSVYVQIAGWFRWLESRMDLKRRMLSLIVSGDLDREPGHLTIVAREILTDDFLLLTNQAGSLPYLDDLASIQNLNGSEAGDVTEGGPDPGPGTWVEFAGGMAPAT